MGIRTASILFSLMGHTVVVYMVAPFFVSDPQSTPPKQVQLNITVTQATNSTEASQPPKPLPDAAATPAKNVPLGIAKAIEEKQIQEPQKIAHQAIPQPKPAVNKAPVQVAEKPPEQPQVASSQPAPEPEIAPTKQIEPQVKNTPVVAVAKRNTPAILEIESSYTSDLLKAIERHRRYPLRARRRGDEGEVLIDFIILQDGEITGIQIASSSNSSSLDRAASKALEQLKQFRPIPHQLQRASWDFRIPVRFALN